MNLQPTLQKLYPDGTYGGQCFTFLHHLVDFPPVGNLLASKKNALKSFGIPIHQLDSIKIGDILLFDYQPFGHGSLVENFVNGMCQLKEANFNYNLKVGTRLISPNDPHILGVFRKPLLFQVPKRILQVKLVQNGDWVSLGEKFIDLRQRFLAAQDQIDINIDVEHVTFPNVPFSTTEYIQGRVGVDQAWYDQNITPRKGSYDVVCFLTDNAPDNGATFGWHTSGQKNQVFAQENEVISSASFGTMSVFVQAFIHETCHSLKEMDGGEDLTHTFLNNQPGPGLPGIFDLAGFMKTVDFSKVL